MELENSLKRCLTNDQEPFRICIPRWFGAAQCFEYKFRFSKSDAYLGVLTIKTLSFDNKTQALTTKEEWSTNNPFTIRRLSNNALVLVIEKLHVQLKDEPKTQGPSHVSLSRPLLIHCFPDAKKQDHWEMQCPAEVAQTFFTLNTFDSQFGLISSLVNGLVEIQFGSGHMTLNIDLNMKFFRIPYLRSQEIRAMPLATDTEDYDLEAGTLKV